MAASEREFQPRRQSAEPTPTQTLPVVSALPAVPSMRDLLASCVAASAVSTPPRAEIFPEGETRDAA